ncbi:piggyBac transposable element-derived protein 4-like isoform X1 [Poecilia formosa]|uniref:piggyBac transposable element-derived protein 4-like isoform X1 n=1 Tax=Poecilia formosa TaxID=48698 RepID=UPI0007B816EC|nr:PREDICTED: piggyBac transposable element-derived protein 4-like isoform X1 [Poecilia formosa]
MASKMKKVFTAEGVLDILTTDNSGQYILIDSSSDEEDLVHSDGNTSDPDYEIPTSVSDDGDDEEDPQLSGQASSSTSRVGPCSSASPAQPHPDLFQCKDTQKKRKQKAPHTSVRPKRHRSDSGPEEQWHNREDEDQKPQPLRFVPARMPGPTFDTTSSWSPLSLFQLFFSSSVVRAMIDNTNANAARRLRAGRKFIWKELTVKDFYIFMAIIIFTSLVRVHHASDYWRKSWPYNFSFPGDKMTRCRFESILWSLHLSNPQEDEENEKKKNTSEYDRLFKIKPLYTDIVTACQTYFQPHQKISIDERMVASKARNSMKRYQKDKPTKWGYKLFVLADSSTGYTWNFFIYTGKNVSTTGQGLRYSSVMDLLPFSLLGKGYMLFVDHFYTSPTLFKDLSSKNIGCCGTIRKTCVGFPQTTNNDLPKKAERGDIRWLRRGNLLFVKWMDTREVTMCSTVHTAFSGKTIQRRVKSGGVWQTKSIPAPDSILDYNKHMGGVDLSDALISYYSVQQKSMKWYKKFFYHFMDIATVNSFILYKELLKLRKDPASTGTADHKKFKEQLAEEMLEFAECSTPSSPPPQPLTCMPEFYESADDNQTRKYCRRCKDAGFARVKTPIYCRRCQVPLCLSSTRNCFKEWHDAK